MKEYIWECLHKVSWKDVDDVYRDLYGCFSALLVITQMGTVIATTINIKWYTGLVKICDLGILLGSNNFNPILQKIITSIHSTISQISSLNPHTIDQVHKRRKIVPTEHPTPNQHRIALPPPLFHSTTHLSLAHSVERVTTPDMLTFHDAYFTRETPVLLTECMEDWPAVSRWNNLEYILSGTPLHIHLSMEDNTH